MARIRSPNYPAISLAEAIERVGKAFAKENRHPASREVMVKALGYGTLHGVSAAALSALVKYGLLDKDGDNYRVSDRAMAVLHPRSAEEKTQALRAAAQAPALFAELLAEYPGALPSDDNLRAYLIRRDFAPSALPGVIQALRDTMELAFPDGKAENPPPSEGHPETRREGRVHPGTAAGGLGGASRMATSSRATLALAEGVAAVEFPDRLSAESFEDLKDWMEVMLRRAERVMKRTEQEAETDPAEETN